MKRHGDFLLREVAGRQVIVPVGKQAAKFFGMISLNETGAFLWQQLETEQTVDSLAQALTGNYEVSEELARKDVEAFLEKLRPTGALVEE